MTLGMLRLRFWIPQGRAVVKRWRHQCVTCTRWRAATPQPKMGNLPPRRVTQECTTISSRGHRLRRAYIHQDEQRAWAQRSQSVHRSFVCFSSKAVHLEVSVSAYTTDAFLAALRRFTSRRGLCTDIYSDCGTNFSGADRQLREMLRASSSEGRKIAHVATSEGIHWHFNPPSAPHFGGLWEAAMKSAKYHLRRTIGETRLTFEEMSTLLAQVGACLNSRPMHALSDDSDDLTALTPGHLLIGAPLLAIPEPSLTDKKENLLSRYRATCPADARPLLAEMVTRVLTHSGYQTEMDQGRFATTHWIAMHHSFRASRTIQFAHASAALRRIRHALSPIPRTDFLSRMTVTLNVARKESKAPINFVQPMPRDNYDCGKI